MIRMIHTKSPLSFKVECKACYGMEIWSLGRIAGILTANGQLPPTHYTDVETDVEFVAEQFIAHHKKIYCPGCNKLGVLTVRRIV